MYFTDATPLAESEAVIVAVKVIAEVLEPAPLSVIVPVGAVVSMFDIVKDAFEPVFVPSYNLA